MPKLTIDHREVEVPPGATVLDAARALGIEIPVMCFLEGYKPSTSCLVCTVKVVGTGRLVPACATIAEEGMQIGSETDEVHQVRRSALELLLSDHLGDCLAPCYFACSAQMHIPQMLRQIVSGDLRGAIETVKRDIALPAVLGRICPAPCEKACRRRPADGAVAICRLKRFVADADLAAGEVYLPPQKPATGKRVAILGAGPTGLSAAYYLLQNGHACTLFDDAQQPGGRLLTQTTEQQLPRDVLDAEIEPIVRLGAEIRMGVRMEGSEALAELRREFEALLIACGSTAMDRAEAWGLKVAKRGIEASRETYRTDVEGLFAAGTAIRGKVMVIRSLADGKGAAAAIDRHLEGKGVRTLLPERPAGCFAQKSSDPFSRPFNVRIGRMEPDELAELLDEAGKAPRRDPAAGSLAGFAPDEAAEQAARCLHCDCRALDSCKLRQYARAYGANPRRFAAERRRFHLDTRHPEVLFEPGKCIDCGLCIEIASAAGEPLGLTFVGRGFDVRVDVPLGRSLRDALQKVAAECAQACPTAALVLRDDAI